MRVEPIKVLSHLPYCPCGVTARLLAEDCLGDDTDGNIACVRYAIKVIQEEHHIPVSSASLRETGHQGSDVLHFWLDLSRRHKLKVERLVKPILDAEFQVPLPPISAG